HGYARSGREPPVPDALDTRAPILVTGGPGRARPVPSRQGLEIGLDPVQTRRGGLQTWARIEAQQRFPVREWVREQRLHALRRDAPAQPNERVVAPVSAHV